jgi:hypothetical protein
VGVTFGTADKYDVSVQVATGIAGQRDGAGFTPDLQYGGLNPVLVTRTPGARGTTQVKRLAPSQRQLPVEEKQFQLCARGSAESRNCWEMVSVLLRHDFCNNDESRRSADAIHFESVKQVKAKAKQRANTTTSTMQPGSIPYRISSKRARTLSHGPGFLSTLFRFPLEW